MNAVTRSFILALGALTATAFCVPAQEAEDSQPPVSGKDKPAPSAKPMASQKTKKKPGPVAKALKKLKWFNGKPNANAIVYMYLQSASWCGPCNKEMPGIAKEYRKMKKDGRVELVLLGRDKSEASAEVFLKDYGADFPGTMADGKNVDKLPGFAMASGVPHLTIVDVNGNVLRKCHPQAGIASWKEYADQVEAELKAAGEMGEEPSDSAVGEEAEEDDETEEKAAKRAAEKEERLKKREEKREEKREAKLKKKREKKARGSGGYSR